MKRWIAGALAFVLMFSIVPLSYAANDAGTDVVATAKSQIGTSNGDKYRTWFYGKNKSVAWCAIFVSWCADQAGVIDAIPKSASVGTIRKGVLNAGGQIVDQPQAGDLVFYWLKTDRRWGHVGIMIAENDSVQGNVGGKVKQMAPRKYYRGGQEYRIEYIRPNYGENTVASIKEVFTYDATDITETSAQLNGYIQVTGRNGHITEHGACIGTCPQEIEMWEAAVDYVDHYKNTLSIFYNTAKYGTELYPGTTYYYYCYAVIDGELVEGEIKSFTTKGTPDEPTEEPSAEPTEEPTTGTSTPINVTVIAHPDEGTYTLTPKCAPNNRLDVDNGSKNDEANIQVYKANNTASQQFEIKKTSDGYYEIVACVSGKALDMSGGNSASKTNIWQYRRNSTAAQKWQFEDAGDGYYYIVPYLNEGLCLDVAGGTTASGANVWAYEKNQGNAQKWMLTKVEQTVTPVVKNYKDGVIGENDMRVRSGPGTSYQHIGTIPSGSIVQVYTDKTSGNWYYVKYNDLEGYVYKNGITIQ